MLLFGLIIAFKSKNKSIVSSSNQLHYFFIALLILKHYNDCRMQNWKTDFPKLSSLKNRFKTVFLRWRFKFSFRFMFPIIVFISDS